MNFSCDRDLIFEALNIVIKPVPQKASIPVLEGICFEIEADGTCRLTGSDVEMSIETVIHITAEEKCSFVVPAKKFFDMISKIDSGNINFTLDPNKMLHIVSGMIKFDISTQDAEFYPQMPLVEKSKSIVIKQELLLNMIKQTLFSVSEFEAKATLRGLYFCVEYGFLTVVGSDMRRMAMRKEEFLNTNGEDFSFIVPAKTAAELSKIITGDTDVIIGIASTHIVFEFDETKVTSRLISGEYIKYKSLLKREFKNEVIVNCDDLKKALERALIVNDKSNSCIRVNFEYDSIVIYCRTSEGHSLTDEIPCKKTGENMEIGFKGKYLLDVLNGCGDKEIKIKIDSARTPACLVPTDGSDRYIYLISPMNINND